MKSVVVMVTPPKRRDRLTLMESEEDKTETMILLSEKLCWSIAMLG